MLAQLFHQPYLGSFSKFQGKTGVPQPNSWNTAILTALSQCDTEWVKATFGTLVHMTPNNWCSLCSLSVCLSLTLSISLNLPQSLSHSLLLSPPHPFKRNMDALTLWAESLGKGPKRTKVAVWAGKECESHLDLFRRGCTCGEHRPSLVLASNVKHSNYMAVF